jgi:hypothetical protein
MSKRAADDSDARTAKQSRQAVVDSPAKGTDANGADEGMGEFEDQFGDEEESDGEVVENEVDGDDDEDSES